MSTIDLLPGLPLVRLDGEAPAGLWTVSLPWPRAEARPLALGGRPTAVRPLGGWPGAAADAQGAAMPRRLLLAADGGPGPAPATLRLGPSVDAAAAVPAAEAVVFEDSEDPAFLWHRHYLRVGRGDRWLGIALGLRTGGAVHWWEACRLVERERSPHGRTVEMAGAIPHEIFDGAMLRKHAGADNPYLHRHNWLNGHLVVRLHAGGLVEVFARHVNARFVDDGRELADAVPVIGLVGPAVQDAAAALEGPWTGERDELAIGGVRLDLGEVARLATPEQPGRVDAADGFLVLQPYEGMELFGGHATEARTGDPWICRSGQRRVPRGASRTLRFSFSVSDRPPRVARYQAPAWWYGLCAELSAGPRLPASPAAFAEPIRDARAWLARHVHEGGFEDGAAPRAAAKPGAGGRHERWGRREPGWEGDLPYAALLAAWRDPDGVAHARALRSAYHFTDLAVDHAAKLVRMHGFPPPAFSLPMQRVLGTIGAWLETGDPVLLDTARAVVDNAHWLHKNSWPRLATGRDACFLRAAVMLYRYTGDDHYRRIAREGCGDVAESQRADGSFGDQGGGTGIHARSGYVVKPWMGTLAIMAVMDYLDLYPDEAPLARCVSRYGDWLRANWTEAGEGSGWSYQHAYGPHRRHFHPSRQEWIDLPTEPGWHQESLGRILAWCTRRTGDPAYLDAWARSHAASRRPRMDQSVSALLQFLPALGDELWRASWRGGELEIDPLHLGPNTPREATIETPAGPVRVGWDEGDSPVATMEGAAAGSRPG